MPEPDADDIRLELVAKEPYKPKSDRQQDEIDRLKQVILEMELNQNCHTSPYDFLEASLRDEQNSTRRILGEEIRKLATGINEATDLARASVIVDIFCAMAVAAGLLVIGHLASGGQ